jgi:hypothetical protein
MPMPNSLVPAATSWLTTPSPMLASASGAAVGVAPARAADGPFRRDGQQEHRRGQHDDLGAVSTLAQPFGYLALAFLTKSLVYTAARSSLALAMSASTLASARKAVSGPLSGNRPSGDSAPLAARKASM